MFLTFKYRLFVNANQERELGIVLESHRRLYNECLSLRQMAYQCYRARITYQDCAYWFTRQRRINTYYARLSVPAAQATMRRLDRAFGKFFQNVKKGDCRSYPRLKTSDRFNVIEYPNDSCGIRLRGNRLYVQHVGTMRVKLHRDIEGVTKNLFLRREADKWFVVIVCEVPDPVVPHSTLPAAGIDVGLTHFLTDSNGAREANPRYLATALPLLRRCGRAVARTKPDSRNRVKAASRLSKLYANVSNRRREHHYQVATRLVLAFGFIAVERLNITAMLKSNRFGRAIRDVAWGNFLSILQHKAKKAGVQVVMVDPKGTSQQCSGCHRDVPKDISDRWHDCKHCGLSLDRDHNAALNILARGLARTAPAGLQAPSAVQRSRHT